MGKYIIIEFSLGLTAEIQSLVPVGSASATPIVPVNFCHWPGLRTGDDSTS